MAFARQHCNGLFMGVVFRGGVTAHREHRHPPAHAELERSTTFAVGRVPIREVYGIRHGVMFSGVTVCRSLHLVGCPATHGETIG